MVNHQNWVAGIVKGYTPVFTIATPHVVPQFTTVEWTMHNKRLDADFSGRTQV